jgi:hypothetical protein
MEAQAPMEEANIIKMEAKTNTVKHFPSIFCSKVVVPALGKKNNNNTGRTHPYNGDGGMKAAIRELTNVVKQCHAEHMDKMSGLEKALQELVAMQGKAEKKEGDEKKKESNEVERGTPQIN